MQRAVISHERTDPDLAKRSKLRKMRMPSSSAWGFRPRLEGEEGDAFNADASGDKLSLKLPGVQEELLELLAATGKPLIVALFAGSPLDLRKVDQLANAVIQAWYPGQDGGKALAEILFGDFNPSGRLPVTFVRSDEDLPPFEDYSMKGRTYRYLEKPPLYPFGFGLSYTSFEYSDFRCWRMGRWDQCIGAGKKYRGAIRGGSCPVLPETA